MRGSPSITDVARAAGVSTGTVSNVLNGSAVVAPDTRRRVEDAIARLGFVRNAAARSLAAGRSATLGFVVADLIAVRREAAVAIAGGKQVPAEPLVEQRRDDVLGTLVDKVERALGEFDGTWAVAGDVSELGRPHEHGGKVHAHTFLGVWHEWPQGQRGLQMR